MNVYVKQAKNSKVEGIYHIIKRQWQILLKHLRVLAGAVTASSPLFGRIKQLIILVKRVRKKNVDNNVRLTRLSTQVSGEPIVIATVFELHRLNLRNRVCFPVQALKCD